MAFLLSVKRLPLCQVQVKFFIIYFKVVSAYKCSSYDNRPKNLENNWHELG